MNNTIFENKLCPECGKTLKGIQDVIESKIITGVYLTKCSHCNKIIMNAGDHIVRIPEARKDLREEYVCNYAKNEIKSAIMLSGAKGPFASMISELIDKAVSVEEVSENDPRVRTLPTMGIRVTPEEANELKKILPTVKLPYDDFFKMGGDVKVEPISKEEISRRVSIDDNNTSPFAPIIGRKETPVDNNYNTAFVALDGDGDVVEEYAYDSTKSEKENIKGIVEDMIQAYGEDVVQEGRCTLHKLQKIDIKFKEKITYELDM